jgi:hypothetical protein
MSPLGLEPTIPSSEWLQTHALYCMATGIGYIKIYRTVILVAVLFVLKIQSLSIRKGHRLRVFENRVLREILVHNRGEMMENSEIYILKSFIFVCSKFDSACSVCERDEKLRSLAWEM